MNKKLLDELKRKLEEQRNILEKELSKFAKKDENLEGDWDTKYPKADGATGSAALEDAADQVEAYVNLLPVEHDMELRLVDIKSAMEKIKKGTYGKCENCGKDIDIERLKIFPEAKFCVSCDKK
jgi:RNA polymerase-binding transcription factor